MNPSKQTFTGEFRRNDLEKSREVTGGLKSKCLVGRVTGSIECVVIYNPHMTAFRPQKPMEK